ncbi:MAG TPA: hypothetical protein VNA25_09190 [Phycisphaerae bacterium]|nr:hypothetical protein [Phycisphaerae bacterium]
MNRATVGCLVVLLLGVSPVWAAVINVDDHGLLPNTPGQVINISVTGGEQVNGLQFNLQVADGGPENGGSIDGPVITNVDILTGTIFDGNNWGDLGWGPIPGPGPAQLWESWTLTASDTVPAAGLLAKVTFDTTGFFDAISWDLWMKPTLNGKSMLFSPDPIDVVIYNGSITLGPTPQSWSNASFRGDSDVDALTIDFGTLAQGAPGPAVSFSIWNYAVPGSANLNLDTIVGAGDTSTLTTDLAPFTGLPAGSSNSFTAWIDTIDVCTANDHPTWTGPFGPGLPVEALRSLAMQGSIALSPTSMRRIRLASPTCSVFLNRTWYLALPAL